MAGLDKYTSIYRGNNRGCARSKKSEMGSPHLAFVIVSALVIYKANTEPGALSQPVISGR